MDSEYVRGTERLPDRPKVNAVGVYNAQVLCIDKADVHPRLEQPQCERGRLVNHVDLAIVAGKIALGASHEPGG